jgi:hypothetical protein
MQRIAEIPVFAVPKRLKAHGLSEFPEQQSRDMQRLGHGPAIRQRSIGIVLLAVKRAQK